MAEISREMINHILLGVEDSEIRHQFVQRYSKKLEDFASHMETSFSLWQELDSNLSKDIPGAHLSALVYGALHTHLVAMKLFITGLFVPAGNSQRYVLESIATALLASSPKLDVLARYIDNKYSTSKSIRDVQKNASLLKLNSHALKMLSVHSKLYDLTSHPTIFSAASLITLNQEKFRTVLGGHFDEGKAFAYDKEISSRTSLASIFPNIIFGIERNYFGSP